MVRKKLGKGAGGARLREGGRSSGNLDETREEEGKTGENEEKGLIFRGTW